MTHTESTGMCNPEQVFYSFLITVVLLMNFHVISRSSVSLPSSAMCTVALLCISLPGECLFCKTCLQKSGKYCTSQNLRFYLMDCSRWSDAMDNVLSAFNVYWLWKGCFFAFLSSSFMQFCSSRRWLCTRLWRNISQKGYITSLTFALNETSSS